MASLQERRNKDGKLISFSIRVHRGKNADGKQLKPFTATFDVEPTWKEETARKKAEAFASVFEKECKEGIRSDTRLTFSAYCEYVIDFKAQMGVKHSTITRYKEMTKRIYPQIGHIKLKDLRPDILNSLYKYLLTANLNIVTGGQLSSKTVVEHHRLISTVLEQAVREGLIPFNVASRSTPPKIKKKEVNYFQPEEIQNIRIAAENEPLKWKTLLHIFLITGARRGEILGLKWSNVDFENNMLYICNSILYSSDIGIYEDTPKTETSKRYIVIPEETTKLLKQYKREQATEQLRHGIPHSGSSFVFCQYDGEPMHPDSVSRYMTKFSKKYGLPHINPHAFRHTMASLLYYNGADSVSISKRLGHAQVSTTANIYAHIISDADKKNAEILADIFLKTQNF